MKQLFYRALFSVLGMGLPSVHGMQAPSIKEPTPIDRQCEFCKKLFQICAHEDGSLAHRLESLHETRVYDPHESIAAHGECL